jgi:uncharacterized protein
MNSHTRALSLLLLLFGIATDAYSAQPASYPPVTIAGSEVRTIISISTGRSYNLYIRKPADYNKGTQSKYPVLYLLDGQWDFKLLDSVVGGLVYDKWMPDVVVVGITYSSIPTTMCSARWTTPRRRELPVVQERVRGF